MDKYKQIYQTSPAQLRRHPRFGPMTETGKIWLYIILHAVLALMMRFFPLLATAHALVVFALAAWTALTEDDLKKLIPLTAYIIGAEVLWRMTRANVFWEFGKYALVAVMVIALLKRRKIRKGFWPVMFFLVLIPSAFFTVEAFGWSRQTRELISFNLSGPLAASVSLLFFKQVKGDIGTIKDWVWPAVYPIFGVLTLAVYSTLTASAINFTTESQFITSGGYGPNQVSAVLGLGALLLVMLAISEGQRGRLVAVLLALALLTQSFLTFSRGGVYNFAIALALATLHLLGRPDKFVRGVFVVAVVVIVAAYFIVPRLDIYTGGLLVQRFLDLDPTGRIELAKADLQLFLRNPVLGVGPGMAGYLREGFRRIAPHTEFTRLLAEHGAGGILGVLILLGMILRSYFKANDALVRAWVVALAAWSFVEMGHAAMRIAAISYLLGLAVMQWQAGEEAEPPEQMIRMGGGFKNG